MIVRTTAGGRHISDTIHGVDCGCYNCTESREKENKMNGKDLKEIAKKITDLSTAVDKLVADFIRVESEFHSIKEKEEKGMSKIKLFKDGILKPKYINPRYIGSWETCCGNSLISIYDNVAFYHYTAIDKGVCCHIDGVAIPEFTPSTIPEYELCWFYMAYVNKGDGQWVLGRFEDYEEDTKKFLSIDNIQIDLVTGKHEYNAFDYCVPLICAQTSEEAEERKGWFLD